jgi:hypothetical protein
MFSDDISVAWALIVFLANQHAFPANICCFCRGRPYANYPSGMLEVTIARVIHDIQLNHVLQVPDPCRWSSKACLLPIVCSVHDCPLTVRHGKIVTHQRYIQDSSCGIPSVIVILPSFNIIQQDQAGTAKINEEFSSPYNNRLIIHDSEGYEPGNKDKFDVLEKFITERSQREPITEKLHAIWCAYR